MSVLHGGLLLQFIFIKKLQLHQVVVISRLRATWKHIIMAHDFPSIYAKSKWTRNTTIEPVVKPQNLLTLRQKQTVSSINSKIRPRHFQKIWMLNQINRLHIDIRKPLNSNKLKLTELVYSTRARQHTSDVL